MLNLDDPVVAPPREQVVLDEIRTKLCATFLPRASSVTRIWAFVGMKAKTVPEERGGAGIGDAWTWTALDPDTKLMCSWPVGGPLPRGCRGIHGRPRAGRLANRVQITTDGFPAYVSAIAAAFGSQVDEAMLVKEYGTDPKEDRRFSPPVVLSETVRVIEGAPNPEKISTSYVERSNLTMRMGMRRLTNGFSEKAENLAAAVAVNFMYYNFARPHKTLGSKTTPAMAAEIASHCWTVEEICRLLESN